MLPCMCLDAGRALQTGAGDDLAIKFEATAADVISLLNIMAMNDKREVLVDAGHSRACWCLALPLIQGHVSTCLCQHVGLFGQQQHGGRPRVGSCRRHPCPGEAAENASGNGARRGAPGCGSAARPRPGQAPPLVLCHPGSRPRRDSAVLAGATMVTMHAPRRSARRRLLWLPSLLRQPRARLHIPPNVSVRCASAPLRAAAPRTDCAAAAVAAQCATAAKRAATRTGVHTNPSAGTRRQRRQQPRQSGRSPECTSTALHVRACLVVMPPSCMCAFHAGRCLSHLFSASCRVCKLQGCRHI